MIQKIENDLIKLIAAVKRSCMWGKDYLLTAELSLAGVECFSRDRSSMQKEKENTGEK